jgi:eukaryotic-like serine/threonine-protein kinase
MRELKWAADAGTTGNISGPVETVPAKAGSRLNNRVAWTFAGVLGAALIGASLIVWRHVREVVPISEVIQFTIPSPENTQFGGPPGAGMGQVPQAAVSPDGRAIVFVARGNQAQSAGYQLWLRPIGVADARVLPGTDGAAFPFWSPDSQSIGFFAGGKLKRVPVSGGPPVELCSAGVGRGTWSRDNVILLSIGGLQGLHRVSAAGGVPVPVSVVDTEYGESGHRWPVFLPDGHHFLYTGYTGACCPAPKPARIRIGSLDSKEVTTLMEVESSVLYTSGYLLFTRYPPNGPLMAQPFDPESRRLTGDAFQVVEQVASEPTRYASVSVSDTGVLLYARGVAQASTQLT